MQLEWQNQRAVTTFFSKKDSFSIIVLVLLGDIVNDESFILIVLSVVRRAEKVWQTRAKCGKPGRGRAKSGGWFHFTPFHRVKLAGVKRGET
jgi:hypothetical protein